MTTCGVCGVVHTSRPGLHWSSHGGWCDGVEAGPLSTAMLARVTLPPVPAVDPPDAGLDVLILPVQHAPVPPDGVTFTPLPYPDIHIAASPEAIAEVLAADFPPETLAHPVAPSQHTRPCAVLTEAALTHEGCACGCHAPPQETT